MLTHDLFAVANFPVSFLFNHAFTQQWFDLPLRASDVTTPMALLKYDYYCYYFEHRKCRFKGLKAKESKKKDGWNFCFLLSVPTQVRPGAKGTKEPLWTAKGDCFTGRMSCLSPNQQRQNTGEYIRTLRLKGKGRRVQFFFSAHRVSIAAWSTLQIIRASGRSATRDMAKVIHTYTWLSWSTGGGDGSGGRGV